MLCPLSLSPPTFPLILHPLSFLIPPSPRRLKIFYKNQQVYKSEWFVLATAINYKNLSDLTQPRSISYSCIVYRGSCASLGYLPLKLQGPRQHNLEPVASKATKKNRKRKLVVVTFLCGEKHSVKSTEHCLCKWARESCSLSRGFVYALSPFLFSKADSRLLTFPFVVNEKCLISILKVGK